MKQSSSKADAVAKVLQPMANDKRLMVLAKLSENGEMRVNALAASVSLFQSVLSQHLAKLRLAGIVNTRSQAKTVHYRLSKDVRGRVLLPFLIARFKF